MRIIDMAIADCLAGAPLPAPSRNPLTRAKVEVMAEVVFSQLALSRSVEEALTILRAVIQGPYNNALRAAADKIKGSHCFTCAVEDIESMVISPPTRSDADFTTNAAGQTRNEREPSKNEILQKAQAEAYRRAEQTDVVKTAEYRPTLGQTFSRDFPKVG